MPRVLFLLAAAHLASGLALTPGAASHLGSAAASRSSGGYQLYAYEQRARRLVALPRRASGGRGAAGLRAAPLTASVGALGWRLLPPLPPPGGVLQWVAQGAASTAAAVAAAARVVAAACPLPSPAAVKLAGVFACGVATGVLWAKCKKLLQRFKTADEVPLAYFREGRVVRGRVASVTDGDTFRMWHTPPWPAPQANTHKKQKLSETTIVIRLAAIDTPETAKFGQTGQPFGEEAKTALQARLEGQVVSVKLLHRDQYSRAVGRLSVGRWPFQSDVADALLQAGLASMYRQSGAVYGGKLAQYEQLEAAAQASKTGMWGLGDKLETAADYKRRTKALS